MARRIKVCQVLNRYSVGGAEMVALEVARGLDTDRFESLAVAVIEPRQQEEPEMRRRFRESGIHAHALYHESFRDPRTILDLIRFFRRQQPDIIHCHQRFSDYWACRVGRWAGVPHRLWTRHSVYRDMDARQINRYRNAARHTPFVLAVSDAVRRNCLETEGLPAPKVRTLVNGIDTSRFAPRPSSVRCQMRAELGVANHEHLLLFVGRLSHEKTPEAFPALVAILRERGLPVRGYVCGTGPLEEQVTAAATKAGVIMLGLRRDIPDLLAACDLLVSTSRIEGLPLNIMEAMAAGRPFVGPDLDQVLQLVDGDADLAAGVYPRPPDVVPAPDELLAQWADITAARLTDADSLMRAAARGREVIIRRFSLERMIAAHDELYTEIVQRR